MRRGMPIAEAPLSSGAVNPQITYNNIFGEWEAATAAGLDMYKWESAGYPAWFQARVLAWHKGHVLVEAHTQDAISTKMRQKYKR